MSNWRNILSWQVDPATQTPSSDSIQVGSQVSIKNTVFTDYAGTPHSVSRLVFFTREGPTSLYVETRDGAQLTGTVARVIEGPATFLAIKLDGNIPVRVISKSPYRRQDGSYNLYPYGDQFVPVTSTIFSDTDRIVKVRQEDVSALA